MASLWLREAGQIPERLRTLTIDEKKKPTVEDPLYPWVNAAKTGWEKLEAEYAALPKDGNDFTDFTGWIPEGTGLTDGPVSSGDFALETEGDHAITAILPRGLYTNALSDKFTGALRSPLLPKDRKFISLLVAGGKLGARRTIIDGGPIGVTSDNNGNGGVQLDVTSVDDKP